MVITPINYKHVIVGRKCYVGRKWRACCTSRQAEKSWSILNRIIVRVAKAYTRDACSLWSRMLLMCSPSRKYLTPVDKVFKKLVSTLITHKVTWQQSFKCIASSYVGLKFSMHHVNTIIDYNECARHVMVQRVGRCGARFVARRYWAYNLLSKKQA